MMIPTRLCNKFCKVYEESDTMVHAKPKTDSKGTVMADPYKDAKAVLSDALSIAIKDTLEKEGKPDIYGLICQLIDHRTEFLEGRVTWFSLKLKERETEIEKLKMHLELLEESCDRQSTEIIRLKKTGYFPEDALPQGTSGRFSDLDILTAHEMIEAKKKD